MQIVSLPSPSRFASLLTNSVKHPGRLQRVPASTEIDRSSSSRTIGSGFSTAEGVAVGFGGIMLLVE